MELVDQQRLRELIQQTEAARTQPKSTLKGSLVWRIGVEHFCLGCHKSHKSTVWYHRPSVDGVKQEWLCSIKYILLSPEDMKLWQVLPAS